MNKNILIFRTDRIGDLLYTCPTIKTIKENISNSYITLITSEKNYNYAKSFEFLNKVLLFPKKGFFNKLKFIRKLQYINYDYIYIFDGKDRSIISAILLKSKNKVSKIVNNKQKNICKLFSIKYSFDIFGKDLNITHEELLKKNGSTNKISNFDYLKYKKDNNFSKTIPFENFILVHLDEKWFSSTYIKHYREINPSFENFSNFIKSLTDKNNKIVITTGLTSNNLIERLMQYSIRRIGENVHIFNIKEDIIIVNKPTFLDLESLLRKTKTLITCHGSMTHAAASFNIKIIDIVEETRKELVERYSLYINNYYKVYRANFKTLVQNILQKI